MPGLRLTTVADAPSLRDWKHVHNEIIRAGQLSDEQVRDRARKHHLEVAYLDDNLVGCTTVRRATGPDARVVVIVRVLPAYRRRGIGATLLIRAEKQAHRLGAGRVETIVWAANLEGLHFAEVHGYTEVDRYLVPGDEVPYVTLRRRDAG
jgi:GNAT superfamily N-acetyltransferase